MDIIRLQPPLDKPGLHSTANLAKVCNGGYDFKVFELFIITSAMRGSGITTLINLSQFKMFIFF